MRARTTVVIAASVGVAAVATGVSWAGTAPESAPRSVPAGQEAVSAGVPYGGGTGPDDSYDYRKDNSRILVNERSYSADPGSCVAVVNVANAMLGATTFNIRNDSGRTVEFFTGITCDTGAPVATVGPHSSSNSVPGLTTGPVAGLPGDGIIVGSFRVRD